MLPIRDDIPNVHRPWGVYLLILLNTLVFMFELGLTPRDQALLFHIFGVVPAVYEPYGFFELLTRPALVMLPFFTHMFLHSGLLHFLLNMWVLWIFADNVEDVMGTWRFLVYYLLCGVGAAFIHTVFNAGSEIPVVGASGAIAGMMGAYFILYPYGRVITLIPIFIIPWFVELPAVIFLGLWFAIQIFSGMAEGLNPAQGGVAWWAHAGGFVLGIALLPLFRVKERCHYCFDKSRRRYGRKDLQ